jgi:hypothetical protein
MALLAGGLAWVITMCIRSARLPEQFTASRLTCRRSMLPILAAVLVVAELSIHLTLGWAERRHVTSLQQPGYHLFTNEIKMSAYKVLRDQMVAEHRALMKERYGVDVPSHR